MAPVTPAVIVLNIGIATTYQGQLHYIQSPNSTFFH